MLLTVIVVLVVLWALGLATAYTAGGLIHVLLVIAVIVMLIRIIQGRNPLKVEPACDDRPVPMKRQVKRKTRSLPAAGVLLGGFDLEMYLAAVGPASRVLRYARAQVVFSQGDAAPTVKYIQKGAVKISVLSRIGKEAVVAILGPGDFFGEGALTGQSVRIGTATALVPTSVLSIDKDVMARLLRDEPTFSNRFISHMLSRNVRIEADLVDQLFNSSEKRLARTLLLMARYGLANPEPTLPMISQETLAEIIGTTRSRVNFFMNKFRKLGLIEYNGTIKVNRSLLGVVLHD